MHAELEKIAADLDAKAASAEDLADPKKYRHPPEFNAGLMLRAEAHRRAAAIIRMQIECEA